MKLFSNIEIAYFYRLGMGALTLNLQPPSFKPTSSPAKNPQLSRGVLIRFL